MRFTHLHRRIALLAGLPATLALSVPTAPAHGNEPAYIGWSAALPSLAWEYVPTSSDDCVAGRVPCVEKTIKRMQQRLDPLVEECAHSAVFGLAYLRTTEEYLETATTPGFYTDPNFVNHEDVVFGEVYFAAYDDWAAGRLSEVPPAWRVAFDTASDRQVTGTGDLLLGMNAHVNRDLPFVLATIGVVAPDGSSRKPDHDRINVMLNRVVEPLIAELSARFDPDMGRAQTPYGVGYTGVMQALVTWREAAWRHAEQLVMAPDDDARERVAESIEQYALLHARAIVDTTSYAPPLTTSSSRDLYCTTHAEDGAP